MADLALPENFGDPGGAAGLPVSGSGGNVVLPVGSVTSPAVAPADPLSDYYQRLAQNPLYRVGTALTGKDPAGDQLLQRQKMDLAKQQMRMLAGNHALDFFAKVSALKPAQRGALVQFGKSSILPLLKEMNIPVTDKMFDDFASTPGLANKYGIIISDLFGKDDPRAQQLMADVDALDDPKAREELVNKTYRNAVDQSMERVKSRLAKLTQTPALKEDLAKRTAEGKPVSATELLAALDELFTTNVERAAAAEVLTDQKHADFVESLGLKSGKRAAAEGDIGTKKKEEEETRAGKVETARQTAAARKQGEREGEPFAAETEVLKLQKLRNEVANGKLTGLPESVQAELRAQPDYKDGTRPTTDQAQRAIKTQEDKLLTRAREQGLAAANIPARTPEAHMRRLEDFKLAQDQLGKFEALAQKVDLKEIAGGLSGWFNQIKETGKVGPFPFPTPDLKPDQVRLLSHMRDYADTVLRLRSGAQINEQEFARMLTFLPTEFVKPKVLVERLAIQREQLGTRLRIMGETLKEGGYRGGSPAKSPKDMSDEELRKSLGQ